MVHDDGGMTFLQFICKGMNKGEQRRRGLVEILMNLNTKEK